MTKCILVYPFYTDHQVTPEAYCMWNNLVWGNRAACGLYYRLMHFQGLCIFAMLPSWGVLSHVWQPTMGHREAAATCLAVCFEHVATYRVEPWVCFLPFPSVFLLPFPFFRRRWILHRTHTVRGSVVVFHNIVVLWTWHFESNNPFKNTGPGCFAHRVAGAGQKQPGRAQSGHR